MVIYREPEIVGSGSFTTVEAVSTLGKTIRYENDYMTLQQAKKGMFSSKSNGKNYRIICTKTETYLDPKSRFHGKKTIVAESDDWSEILGDWGKLESYLLPMVMVMSKKENATMSQNEFQDILGSITDKKTFKQGLRPLASQQAKTKKTLNINGVSGAGGTNSSSSLNEDDYVDLGTRGDDSPTTLGYNQDDDDTKELDSVSTYENAVVAIEEFFNKLSLTQRLLDSYAKKQSQRAVNDIMKHTKRLKALQKMIDDFFKTAAKNSINEKLLRQYSNEKPKLTKLLGNATLKKLLSENTKDIYDKKKQSTSTTANNAELYDEVEASGSGSQQQLQVQQKKDVFVLSSWDRNIIDVENAIAKETHEDLKKLETDFTELHGMFSDMHSIVVEQQESIDAMVENIDSANNHIQQGTENVKKAKKLTRFGLF